MATELARGLRMPAAVLEMLRRQAAQSRDREICGALLGRDRLVVEAVALHNVSATPDVAYEITPVDLLRLEKTARSNGLAVIGFYHSHPTTSAAPSARDLALGVPGYVYVITSAQAVRAWVLDLDRTGFEAVPLEPI